MISIIAAVAENGVIGDKAKIPWHLPQDMKNFSVLTRGHRVIMGRVTYESILVHLKRPLPDRENIVVTRDKNYDAPGCVVVHSLSEAISDIPQNKNVFIIGGAQLYEEALPHADMLYLTKVHTSPDGDTFFPKYDETKWRKQREEFWPRDEKNQSNATYTVYERCR